jgi:hypothetical protein
MERTDALSVIARLMASWPSKQWSDPEVEMWLEDLAAWTVEEGMAATQACRRALDFSPSWAEFYTSLGDARRLQNRTIYTRELTRPGVMTREANREAVKLIRSWYADSDKRRGEHWHGGPEPCPVCGGQRPAHLSGTVRQQPSQAEDLLGELAGAIRRWAKVARRAS